MEQYFILDPYQNIYRNNKLAQQLRSELLNYKESGITGSQTDYDKIAEFLEFRFNQDMNLMFKEYFNIDYRLINTQLIYDDNLFYSRDLFYNERYGQYINSKINELLGNFDISIDYSKKYQMLYEVYIYTCRNNSTEYMENWNKVIKPMSGVNTLFDFFMKTFKRELLDKNRLYYDDNIKIYNRVTRYNQNKKVA